MTDGVRIFCFLRKKDDNEEMNDGYPTPFWDNHGLTNLSNMPDVYETPSYTSVDEYNFNQFSPRYSRAQMSSYLMRIIIDHKMDFNHFILHRCMSQKHNFKFVFYEYFCRDNDLIK